MLKRLIIPMILLILAVPFVGGTNGKTDRLKSFLRLYCQTYESKDIDKFATFFTHDAFENNKPFQEILPKYRRNMEMIESFNYRIELVAYSLSAETGSVRISGKYFTRYLFIGKTWKENSGDIFMDLVKNGDSFLVKHLVYGGELYSHITFPAIGEKPNISQQSNIIRKNYFSNGDYYVALGDSITQGSGDYIISDNNFFDGRNLGGGYPPILSDILTNSKGHPVFIANEGRSGESSAGGSYRIRRVIAIHPEAQYFLILYGTIDSSGLVPIPEDAKLMLNMQTKFQRAIKEARPSGLGLNPGDARYTGSFKDNMQKIIDAISAAGKKPILAKVPIVLEFHSNIDESPRNLLIQEYNQVIEGLVSKNKIAVNPPDFYNYFKENKDQFHDRIHPNGKGYRSIAKLWFNALNQDISQSRFANKKKYGKKVVFVQTESDRGVSGELVKNKTVDNIDSGEKNQEIIFKVQILLSNTVTPTNSPRFKGLKNIWEYKHDGLYKYTVGNQKDLESAIALQLELRKKSFKDAFVVAFQNGKRIPVK